MTSAAFIVNHGRLVLICTACGDPIAVPAAGALVWDGGTDVALGHAVHRDACIEIAEAGVQALGGKPKSLPLWLALAAVMEGDS